MNLSILQSIDSAVENISAPIYYWLAGTIYLIYFASMFGIASVNPDYTDYLNNIVQVFIAFILIIRFNPLRKLSCTPNDRVLHRPERKMRQNTVMSCIFYNYVSLLFHYNLHCDAT